MEPEKVPSFSAIYIDTNVLIANHWPEPLPALANLLDLARWWNIDRCLPVPVLEEFDWHWQRKVNESVDTLASARRKVAKATLPVTSVLLQDTVPISAVHAQLSDMTASALTRFGITVVEFTQRSSEELFRHAVQYRRPFAQNGEGKGYQDAIILLSILDHLSQHSELTAILITNDGDLKNVDYRAFAPDFDAHRLRTMDLEVAFKEMHHLFFDKTRIQPYRQLQQSADRLAHEQAAELKAYAASRLTADILRPLPGTRVVRILSLETLKVRSVDVPFPDSDALDEIELSIKVMGTSKAVIITDVSGLYSLFGGLEPALSQPTEQERTLMWSGLIEAIGTVANNAVTGISPKSLSIEG